MNYCRIILCSCILCWCSCSDGKKEQSPSAPVAWYEYNQDAQTKWSSPENLNGLPGSGARENLGAKGHAYDSIGAGATRTLLDVNGPGIINRIWITIGDRSPEMLRSLKIEMFWDGQDKPAVSVPFGDFFGLGLGRVLPFQNALFINPEGRSFSCFIPMPFRTAAKIQVSNESGKKLSNIFFDVDFQSLKTWKDDNLYFHAYWHRDTATALGKDFELLPAVSGKGRFLGVNIGINANPVYGEAWWGEGEVKMYLNNDREYPSLAGTGTEDYIGTGWGQGLFSNNYAGCLVADDKKKQWAYYRYHIPDPVYFESGLRVTLQQIGGNMKDQVLAAQKAGAPLIPVTIGGVMLYKEKRPLNDPALANGWTNFYRSDDVSATAYFYLGSPGGDLPVLQPVSVRTYNLKTQ